MPTFVQILDFIGTFAFAISGIRLASAKRFDWFGAYVVGLATAIGGGTIRDVLLDVTPGWMTDPIYLICTGVALLWVICFGRWLIRRSGWQSLRQNTIFPCSENALPCMLPLRF